MSKHIRAMIAILVALIALSAAAGTAAAAEATVEPAGEVTSTSLGGLTFTGAEFIRIICRVTLLLSLHRGPIAKTVGNLIGYIKRVSVRECTGGSLAIVETGGVVTNPANVMWHVEFVSILGTLPSNVRGILVNIIGVEFLSSAATIFGTVNCLWSGNLGALLGVTGTNPYTSGLIRVLEAGRIPIKTAALNSGLCPANNSRATGSFNLTPTQRITRT